MPPQCRLGMLLFPLCMASWLIGYILNKVAKQHKARQQIIVIDCWRIADFSYNETAN